MRRDRTTAPQAWDPDEHWERGHRELRKQRIKQALPAVVVAVLVSGVTLWAWQSNDAATAGGDAEDTGDGNETRPFEVTTSLLLDDPAAPDAGTGDVEGGAGGDVPSPDPVPVPPPPDPYPYPYPAPDEPTGLPGDS